MTSYIQKNKMLSNAPMKLVNEKWIDLNTNEVKPLLVRSARICPRCKILLQVDLRLSNCKNISCSNCRIWICLRCVTIVRNIADHKTCCIRCLSGNHSGKHWCYDKGVQVLDKYENIKLIQDKSSKILNFIPKFDK